MEQINTSNDSFICLMTFTHFTLGGKDKKIRNKISVIGEMIREWTSSKKKKNQYLVKIIQWKRKGYRKHDVENQGKVENLHWRSEGAPEQSW